MMMMFKKQIPSAQDDPSNHLRMLSWNGINCSLHNIYSYILYYRFVDSILLKRINHDHLHSVIQFALDITELCNLTKRTKHFFFAYIQKTKNQICLHLKLRLKASAELILSPKQGSSVLSKSHGWVFLLL